MADPQAFEKIVVDEALAARPCAWLYAGYMAWVIWILCTFGGQRIFVSDFLFCVVVPLGC